MAFFKVTSKRVILRNMSILVSKDVAGAGEYYLVVFLDTDSFE